MSEKRIQFNNVIQNQLPSYVREEFPLVAEFLKQYYISQEFQGSATDLIQNVDQYLKLDNIKSNIESTTLTEDISFSDETILVSNTIGFPDSYGLLQINDEVITYTNKTSTTFTGCIRGFSGVTSYDNQNKPDELVFNSTESSDHAKNAEVVNLSSLFLKEFFDKIKYQLTPGFENREFYSGLDKYLFLKQSKDFYSTRGTDLSFKILFKVLYGEDVKIIKPQDYLIKSSDSLYEITNNLVVESITGNPYDLERSTLRQDSYGNIPNGYASISRVEKIFAKTDKTYYKLSFDAGYNKDINVEGSLYGNFSIHPKTKIIGEFFANTNTLDVDSTVGFPLQGELSVLYSDGTEGIISYSSKSLNQFFGCQNVSKPILDGTDIWLNVYAYGLSNKNTNEIIKVRVTSVLKNVDITDDSYYYSNKDTAIIKTLGINPQDEVISNNWVFNISSGVDILSASLIDNASNTYKLVTKTSHNLKIGDNIKILSRDGTFKISAVGNVQSDDTIEISGQGNLDLNLVYSIQRNLLKVNSDKYSHLVNEIANIQNVYKDKNNKTIIASPSLPSYNNQPLNAFNRTIVFSGTFIGDTFTITSNQDHGFYTGDSVYYTSGQGSLFEEGLYFIKRVNSSSIKVAKSRLNIHRSAFINLEEEITVTNSKFEDSDFHARQLESQKLLREINTPINDGGEYPTLSGTVGILINGVEVLNYKSKDKIYYGSIESIDVVNTGSGYDIINPPNVTISDSVGSEAAAYCSVKGTLQEIRVIDPGFDYLEVPKINITGGNGVGAKASASMKLIDYQVSFNTESESAFIDTTNSTIGFSTFHKFRNTEKVIYRTNAQKAVGGITTNSTYYVSVQDAYTVKLHRTFDDSLIGINTISLTSFGIGNHNLESYDKKSVISSINIEDNGSNYENKKRSTSSSGVSTSLGCINIKNHDYKSGEIVRYTTNGSSIGGLVNDTNYYVTKVDENNFKLSVVGVGIDNQDFYYKTNQYIDLTSIGVGTHIFNYPQISVEVVGNTGVSSAFKAQVQPIFRGEVTSVHLENSGVGYGSSEIINFSRDPNITLNSGSESQLIPVINAGKIVEILINNPGKDYNSPPNLSILTNGNGVGAVLTPILENGQIKSVRIIEGGVGYDQNNTSIVVSSSGVDAELKPQLKSWTINLFARYIGKISDDDGFVFYNPNSKYGLEYTHLYAPRKLRESLYAKDSGGKILYGKNDLVKLNNVEVSSTNHSPIIGWAYDGNPIYGPYGFANKNGGNITGMKSGYVLNLSSDRPPFPSGFFIEDYEYKNINDDTVLDECNGRFCITPDFPNGTYAYFATIDTAPSSSFGGYRSPVFPYIIGNKFKSSPNEFNFNRLSNQDDIDLNETKWVRNTTPYNLLKNSTFYSYLPLPNILDQTVDVKYASLGSIENIGIVTGGFDYKVNDKVVFDEEGTGGFGFAAKVSRIGGKSVNSISVASTTINNVEIYPLEGSKNSFIIQSNLPHNFLNKDIISISGINTTSSLIGGSYTIGIAQNTISISNPSGISSVTITGIVTYISVSGNISNVRENDVFNIGSETIKVLNVDNNSSRIRILRSINGTVGSTHTHTDVLYESPRRFLINVGNTTSYGYKVNKEIYFDPKESLGIGTISGVGIGSTLSFSNPGVGITEIFIPTRSIYIPNHNLQTGDSLVYSTNSGSPVSISTNGTNSISLLDQSVVYVAKITNDLIGISTVKVGLGATGTFVGIATSTSSMGTLYFTGIGTGSYHSFKTNYPKLTGKVSKNVVTVSTAQTHGLTNNDDIFVNVNPGFSTSFIVKYDDYNRKILINPISFTSGDINIISNSISIPNHNFQNGQKVVYTSTSPSGGLINNAIYYIVVFDANTVNLSNSYYGAVELNPEIINITSSSSGTLSPVNPPIKVYKDSLLTFDLSDSSLSYLNGSVPYSAFEFNFYVDSNYTQIFNKSVSSNTFEVIKFGRVGIDTGSKVTLSVTDNLPQKLYYALDPVYNSTLPSVKEEVNIDSSVLSNNELQVSFSGYNGKHRVASISSTSFTYNIDSLPESTSYNSSSRLSYETTSLSAYGSVSKVDITSRGQNYTSIPKFSEIISTQGTGSILDASSKSIGKISKTKINNIGFDFSCDFTVRPNLIFPQILKIEPLNSIDYIGITSTGRGYTTAPKLVILDGKTNQVLPEVDIYYSLGDNYATILNNTYRLNDISPIIIPTQNSNGIGIGSISYNPANKDVTVTLSVGFSSSTSFPLAVNDKILIENISVGINSTAKGFNSENYNYQLFTITNVDSNIGGIGTVTYNLSEHLISEEVPGRYDSVNSSGRIIPEKYFPKFNTQLKPNNFFENELVRYPNQSSPLGFVESWNEKTKYVKISSREILKEENILEGVSSKTQGKISSIIKTEGFIDVGSYSKTENGWITETGILNNELQKIQDNLYYQNFSYSLKSKVPYDTWENAVGSLNHTSGFKKFSDYQLESFGYSGISTNVTSSIDVTTDIDGFANLNCVYDFDLVRENALTIDSKTISDEITFSSRILTDYFESVGNRVLSIDDISGEFNSNPRSSKFSIAHKFLLTDARAQKYITYVKDRRYISQRQLMLFTLLHDNNTGYLNQYGRVESVYDLGSFDFIVDGPEGLILFYPTKYKVNDYDVTTLSYNLKDNFSGVGNTILGNIVSLNTNTAYVSSGSTSIIEIDSVYTSSKVLIEISGDNGQYQFNELNLVHDGTNIEMLDYGQLTSHSTDIFSSSGLGTYYPYFSGSNLKIDFIPNVGIAASVSTVQIAIANTSISGVGTFDIKYARFEAVTTSIASTTSPSANIIAEYPDTYDAGYYIIQISDTTNNRHQLSEVVLIDDEYDVYITEFGNIETHSSLGTVDAIKTANSTRLTFTPLPNIDVHVKVFFNSITNFDENNTSVQYNNNTATTDYSVYYGTERDVKLSFDLKHQGNPIFQKYFDGSNPSIVSVASSVITIKNHFFVTGENVTYSAGIPTATASPIGIALTYFGVGIGTTDKLPSSVYIIKVDENNIKLARSAEDALKIVPKALNITSVGIGSSHVFISTKQNIKSLVSIDNVIQSPIVSTSTTTYLSTNLLSVEDLVYLDSTKNIITGDLLRINDEIMKVESVGVGSTNVIRVARPWLGTEVISHSVGSSITKLKGNYNIVKNKINFVEAPYGNIPLGTSTNSPSERDWTGITSSSYFHGRVFMRSGIIDSPNESYYKNYIFDDISPEFNGSQKTFTLSSNGSNITDIFQDNAIILVNDIFQQPGLTKNYNLSESVGVTSISFVGSATSQVSDVNTSNLPAGGIIVSVGSTKGFGYQPLVSAGGSAIVSVAGTISAISIGNSGSGYRSAIETLSGILPVTVRVGVSTYSTGTPNVEFIGTATVSNGNIVSIAVTNPGIGYTSSNPPYVIIDAPLSYSDIPLIYNSSSLGIGTRATVDILVGQESGVIDFEFKNTGYRYKSGDILTVPVGGTTGIPTTPNSTLQEFQITVESVDKDKFSGWSLGELEVLDNIQELFDGGRIIFPLLYNGASISVYAKKGSLIDVKYVLLVFINDILQIPDEGYIFNGGSKIQFTESPKPEDTCKILFYKGSGDNIDVIFRDIIDTVKIGDDLQLTYDSFVGQSPSLLENERKVVDVLSIETVETNPYFGPGNTSNTSLSRPINWCRQTEDLIINEKEISKNREFYEPLIYPSTNIIQPVGIGSTIVYVENLRPFFNPSNENIVSLDFQNNVTLISQDSKISATAAAIVSISGTITSIDIVDGGFGYNTAPKVTLQSSTGIGLSSSVLVSSITSGIVTSISIVGVLTGYSISNPPLVLIDPPTADVESNSVLSYSGDSGIIVGLGTTNIGASTQIILDLFIPPNSPNRIASIAGTATTLSSLSSGDFFAVSNSNVGISTTSIISKRLDGSNIGIANEFLDTIYQVSSAETVLTNVVGVGTTYIRRIFSPISGIGTINFSSSSINFDSNSYTFDNLGVNTLYSGDISTSRYFGDFSWGKIILKSRVKDLEFNYYGNNGVIGITTSTLVKRTLPLKYSNYII